MFQKVLIANRGEIAVRIVRTCRDMGLKTVAIYSAADHDSLHVRLADECLPITSDLRYGDKEEVLALAKQCGADAIHPGYGFLAEEADFAQMCDDAGIAFIGPPAEVIARVRSKIDTLAIVEKAGFPVPPHSKQSFAADDLELMQHSAEEIGYPLVIKSCKGGRGRGERVVFAAKDLARLAGEAQREAATIYGSDVTYLEKVVSPSHHVAVQVLADAHGNIVHLGEYEGTITRHNQKLIEESPAPCLNDEQRARLHEAAVAIARLLNYENVGAVEFLVDDKGNFCFTEMKARIQIEHPTSEMLTDVDLVAEQVRAEAGEPLRFRQSDIRLGGHAMQVRINAEDPMHNYMPSPGVIERFRIPGGVHVRVDTYGYVGCMVPVRYDSLLAKVIVWGETREDALRRMRRALADFKIVGVQTNMPLHMQILDDPGFVAGKYDNRFLSTFKPASTPGSEEALRDLAAAAAVAFYLRVDTIESVIPARMQGGWHRSSRHIPG